MASHSHNNQFQLRFFSVSWMLPSAKRQLVFGCCSFMLSPMISLDEDGTIPTGTILVAGEDSYWIQKYCLMDRWRSGNIFFSSSGWTLEYDVTTVSYAFIILAWTTVMNSTISSPLKITQNLQLVLHTDIGYRCSELWNSFLIGFQVHSNGSF